MTDTGVTYTGETMDVTPRFNYSREVEVVKRYIEKILILAGPDHLGSELVDFARNARVTDEIRKSMGLVMSNDIERQIVVEKNFPITSRQFWFHQYVPYSPEDGNFGDGPIPCSECDGQPDSVYHLFA